jgi:hypothetical protein
MNTIAQVFIGIIIFAIGVYLKIKSDKIEKIINKPVSYYVGITLIIIGFLITMLLKKSKNVIANI